VSVSSNGLTPSRDLWEQVTDSLRREYETGTTQPVLTDEEADSLGAQVRAYAELIEQYVTNSLAKYHRVAPVEIKLTEPIEIDKNGGGSGTLLWPTYRINGGPPRSNRGIPLWFDLARDDAEHAARVGGR
jgi:hypothetical protein